jgi:thioesterase domain-containing protein
VALLAIIDNLSPPGHRNPLGLRLRNRAKRFFQGAGRSVGFSVSERASQGSAAAENRLSRRRKIAIRSHVAAGRKYAPSPYCGHIVFFQAADNSATEIALQRRWLALAAGITFDVVPATHLSLTKKPHVSVLAERLKAYLDASTDAARRSPPTLLPPNHPSQSSDGLLTP